MKRIKLLVVVALALVICLPGMALANYTLSSTTNGASTYWSSPKQGDASLAPYTGGVPAGFSFTSFATEFSDSTIFAGTGTIGYGAGSFTPASGWTATLLSSTVSIATGPVATRPATWDYSFVGTGPIYPLVFDINYFIGGTFVGHEHYSIGGNGGPYVGGFDTTQHAMAPLPPSMLLVGSGLLGLVGLRWRRRQAS